MRNEEMDDGEWLSALADGQLKGDAFAQAMAALGSSDEALSVWHSYHVAGDVLRCADFADCSRDRAFVARLRSRLVLSQAPAVDAIGLAGVLAESAGHPQSAVSANDATVRWKWLAGVASAAAVAVFGWHMSQPLGGATQLADAQGGATLTVTAAAQSPTGEPPVMLRDPRLDELLAAHRQIGGTSALQMPAGFLRNATFEQSGK